MTSSDTEVKNVKMARKMLLRCELRGGHNSTDQMVPDRLLEISCKSSKPRKRGGKRCDEGKKHRRFWSKKNRRGDGSKQYNSSYEGKQQNIANGGWHKAVEHENVKER